MKGLNVLFVILAAGAAIGAANPPPLPPNLPAGEVYVMLQALTVNRTNAVRTMVAASEAEGLKQIVELIRWSQFEEQWAFIPSADLWIEVGRNERADAQSAEVELDIAFLKEIAAAFTEIRVVHFHPASSYHDLGWGVIPALPDSVSGWTSEDLQRIALSMPSPEDILCSLMADKEMRDAVPAARLKHWMVSPHGVVAYGPTEAGFRRLKFYDGDPTASPVAEIVSRYALLHPNGGVGILVRRDDATLGDIIGAVSLRLSSEHFRVTYAPYPSPEPSV